MTSSTLERISQLSAGLMSEKGVCQKHGPYLARALSTFGKRTIFSGCPECLDENEISLEKRKQDQVAQKINSLLLDTQIPLRFQKCSFEGWQVNHSNSAAFNVAKIYADSFLKQVQLGTSLVFCGKPGTGKTYLACAILLSVIRMECTGRYTSAYRMAYEVKGTYRKNSDVTEQTIIDGYLKPSLLVIDEVGVQFGSDTEKLIFYHIINGRYENFKPTILISNFSEQELSGFIGERVMDRMIENGGVIVPFTWQSYRRSNGRNK